MSADNTLYIRPMKDGRYLVAVLYSVFPEDKDWTDEEVDVMIQERSVDQTFETEDEAYDFANKMFDNWWDSGHPIEYGVGLWPRRS